MKIRVSPSCSLISLQPGLEMTFGEAGGFGRNAAVFLFAKTAEAGAV
ncbi:hypothetical protein [Neobacillus piezotolerans]|nr:hypothetical protein [Neobacillus piezotolerans]